MGKRRVMFASAVVVAAGIGVGGIATAHGRNDHLRTTLRGSEEVPVADPDGRGTARVDLDAGKHQICWELRFDRIADPTMAHIHGPAAAGSNAPVLVFFFTPTTLPDLDDLERGRVEGCVENVPDATIQAIEEHPELYYVNVHNLRFPNGAIRGQLD